MCKLVILPHSLTGLRKLPESERKTSLEVRRILLVGVQVSILWVCESLCGPATGMRQGSDTWRVDCLSEAGGESLGSTLLPAGLEL